jgi:tetratricopeptide (TPR) repeat protein
LIRKSFTALTAACLALASTPVGAAPKPKEPTEEQVQAYLADKPEAARPLFRHAMLDGERNQVLYLMRAGLASMDAGDFRSAAAAFDPALAKIEAVYASNPSADKARSKFVKESVKDFKGEGYERSMAYYYRGVLYLFEGDYDNARASFMSGQLQDQWAEDQQYSSDFALMDLLSGWASQCAGDPGLASEFYAKAREKKADIATPKPDDRVLLLAEFGRSPEKWAEGKYQEALHYRRGEAAEGGVVFRLADDTLAAREGESLYRQATTRGGREVDTILAGKASFKQGAEGMSHGASQAALIAVQNSNIYSASGNYRAANNMAYAGMAMGALSLLSAAAANAAKPQADTRYWDNLPDTLAYLTTPSGGAFGQVDYLSAAGGVIASSLLEPRPDPRGACRVSWSRQHASYAIPDIAPNSVLTKK